MTDSIIFETSYNARSIVSQNFAFPEINNKGQVVWEGSDGTNTQIFLERFGQSRNISQNNFDNFQPQINDRGQVVWYGGDNPNTFEIFLYKRWGKPIQLTVDNYFDGAPRINDRGQVVWGKGDFFDENTIEIFLYYGWGKPKQLTNNLTPDILPQISNYNQVVWVGGAEGDREIFLYNLSRRTTKQITHNNYDDNLPQINDRGQVTWYADTGTQDQVWLYQKTFFRARSNLLWSFTYELGKGLTNPDKEKSRRVKKAKVKKREPRKETYKRINAYRTVYSSPIKPW